MTQDQFVKQFGRVGRPIGDPDWHKVVTVCELVDGELTRTHKHVKFFEKMWHPGETCWVGKMKLDDLHLAEDDIIASDLTEYFRCFDSPIPNPEEHTDVFLSLLVKIIWLAYEYNNEGKFAYPLMTFWNPRTQRNEIHPGGGRNKVIKMFSSVPTVDVVYFNTGGFWHDSMSMLKPVTCEQVESLGYQGHVIADHGTFIPQYVGPSGFQRQQAEREIWKEHLHRKLHHIDFGVFYNSDVDNQHVITALSKLRVDDPAQANVILEFADNKNINVLDACRAIVATYAGFDWTTDTVTISHK